MKKAKKFLIAFLVSTVYFIISLIIQYNLSVVFVGQAIMILTAVLSGTLGFVTTMIIINDMTYFAKKKVDCIIYSLIMIYISISGLFLVSSLFASVTINIIALSLFIAGAFLAVVYFLYLVIKKLIKAYKKYKENQ